MSVRILQNQARCLDCGDEPFSAHVHDYRTCTCGNISVDGGLEYIKRGYRPHANMEDMSIAIPQEAYDACVKAIKWAKDTGRDDLGLICAIARALRDNGVRLEYGE